MTILVAVLTLLALAGGYALWAWWRWRVACEQRADDAALARLIIQSRLFGLSALHARLTDEARRRGLKAPPS